MSEYDFDFDEDIDFDFEDAECWACQGSGEDEQGTICFWCCGKSHIGDVRIDTDPTSARTREGNLFSLKFPPQSFDTVIYDPPFRYYNSFKWILNLADIA